MDDLDSLKDYLHILGKIHRRNGIQNHEMLVMGPHFVASAVRYLPSTLRDRRIQGKSLKTPDQILCFTELLPRVQK